MFPCPNNVFLCNYVVKIISLTLIKIILKVCVLLRTNYNSAFVQFFLLWYLKPSWRPLWSHRQIKMLEAQKSNGYNYHCSALYTNYWGYSKCNWTQSFIAREENSTECLGRVQNIPYPKRILAGVLHSTLYHYLLADGGNGKKRYTMVPTTN